MKPKSGQPSTSDFAMKVASVSEPRMMMSR
jgi:hypothetical protein